MPCSDVTEFISVVLDKDERLKEYHFAKRSCGQGIGHESLLIDQLEGRSLEALLRCTPEDFLGEFPIQDEIEEFLSLKHLIAIQSALEVLTGVEPGRKGDAFAAADIAYSEDEVTIEGLIYVDVVTEKIEACGGCGSCGNAAAKKAEKDRAKGGARALSPTET